MSTNEDVEVNYSDYNMWTDIEALDYDLVSKFDHIRDETEAMQFDNERDAIEMVEERLLKENPTIFKNLNFNDVVDVRYESFATPGSKTFEGYAIHIAFREDLCGRIYLDHVKTFPEKIIQFLNHPSTRRNKDKKTLKKVSKDL